MYIFKVRVEKCMVSKIVPFNLCRIRRFQYPMFNVVDISIIVFDGQELCPLNVLAKLQKYMYNFVLTDFDYNSLPFRTRSYEVLEARVLVSLKSNPDQI